MAEPSSPTAPVTLASHGVSVVLDGKEDILAFAAAANDKARIKGLDDALNPGIVDAGKLQAFVAALASQPAPVREKLAGHVLNVGASGLGVLQLEPTSDKGFGPHLELTIERVAGANVLAHASVPVDAATARDRAAAAAQASAAAHQAVVAIEAGGKDPDGLDLGAARWRQAQAARGWLLVAQAWDKAEPHDQAAKQAAAAAQKAASAYDMPSGASP